MLLLRNIKGRLLRLLSEGHSSRGQGENMRKILVLCGVLALVSGIAWQLTVGSTAKSASMNSPSVVTEKSTTSLIPVQGGPPPCPDLETCQDLGCFHTTNSCNTVDTGLSSCTLSDGTIFSCNGNKTVHQKHCRCGDSGPCFTTRDSEAIFCQ